MAIFTLTTIVLTSLASLLAWRQKTIIERFRFNIDAILRKKQFYRIITSQFLHNDFNHLLFNMFSFYAFANSLEQAFGTNSVAVIYLASALGGDFVSLIWHRKSPSYSAIGASGAVAGIIFASIFLLPGGSIFIFPLPIPIPAWLYAILFTLISIYGIDKQGDMIAHEAHLGGAVSGILVSIVLAPSILNQQMPLLATIIILITVFMIYAKIKATW